MIDKTTLYEYHSHPFAIMFEVFWDLYKRRQLDDCVQVPSLNTLPDTNRQTIDEYSKDMTDAADALLKKGFTTTQALVGHLNAEAFVNFVKIAEAN